MPAPKIFTDTYLRALQPRLTDYRVSEPAQKGYGRLILKVRTNGLKEFYFRYRAAGKDRLIKLGNYAPSGGVGLTLAEARERAREKARLTVAGVDVQEQRTAERKAAKEREEAAAREAERESGLATFGKLLDAYVADLRSREKGWKAVDGAFSRYVRRPFPALVEKKASLVTTNEIRGVLGRMVEKGIRREVNKQRSYLHAAFAFGRSADNDPRGDTGMKFEIGPNPVEPIKVIREYNRPRTRELTTEELRDFWKKVAEGSLVIQCFQHLRILLGGQRIAQLARVAWADYNRETRYLRLLDPKGRTDPRDHLVPVSSWAASILKELERITGKGTYIFSHDGGKTPLHPSTVSHQTEDLVEEMLKEREVRRFVAADIRRTVENMLAALYVPKEVRAQLLSHSRTTDVQGKNYDRFHYLPQKRMALRQWEGFLIKAFKLQKQRKSVRPQHRVAA